MHQSLTFYLETYLHDSLETLNLILRDSSSQRKHFEPIHSAYCLGCLRYGFFDCACEALWRFSHNLDILSDQTRQTDRLESVLTFVSFLSSSQVTTRILNNSQVRESNQTLHQARTVSVRQTMEPKYGESTRVSRSSLKVSSIEMLTDMQTAYRILPLAYSLRSCVWVSRPKAQARIAHQFNLVSVSSRLNGSVWMGYSR